MKKRQDTSCPCGSGVPYMQCCGRFIEDKQKAQTPQQLMRSRYTAYSLGNEPYLLSTWHSSTRPGAVDLANGPTIKWTSLEILSAPAANGDEGQVEFVARFKQNGKAGRLHERSRFVRENGEWFYVTGVIGTES